MKTRILSENELYLAIQQLKEGKLIAIPTETVYGLAACIDSDSSLENIFLVKGRPSDNPLIVHVASIAQAKSLTSYFPSYAEKLAEKFWPGPLTIVLPKAPHVSDRVSANLGSVAIRMPNHPVALELIRSVGPLAAPSANLSGKPSPTMAKHVLEDLHGKIEYIVDGGECSLGIESTVVSLLDHGVQILRPGMVTQEAIEDCINTFCVAPSDIAHSPGTKYRHYAPKAKVYLILEERECPYMIEPSEKTLYRDLRKADEEGVTEIYINCRNILKNKALMDRLSKASQF